MGGRGIAGSGRALRRVPGPGRERGLRGQRTGERLWTLNPHKTFRSDKQGYHGFTGSPLVDGDRVFVTLCSRKDDIPNFAAFDIRTGKTVWTASLPPCSTSNGWSRGDTTPILVRAGGKRWVVDYLWRCVAAVDADDGKTVWTLPTTGAESVANLASRKEYLFVSMRPRGGRPAGVVLRIRPDGSCEELWRQTGLCPSYEQAVAYDGRLYAFAGGLACWDLLTGTPLRTVKAPGRPGNVIAADGKVFWQVQASQGRGKPAFTRLVATRPTPEGHEEAGAFTTAVRCDSDPPWVHPVVAGGRLYVRFHDALAVYDLKGAIPP